MKLSVNEQKAHNLLSHAVKLGKIFLTDKTFRLEKLLNVVIGKNNSALEKEEWDVSTVYLNFTTKEALCLLAYINGHNGDTFGERSKWLNWENSINEFNQNFPSVLTDWIKEDIKREREAQLETQARKHVAILMNS